MKKSKSKKLTSQSVNTTRFPAFERLSRERSSTSTVTSSQHTLVLLGASRVGKTTLASQFLWNEFIKEYRPTVEEFNWIEYINDDGNEKLLQVIDTSGSHDFLAMRHLYAKLGDVFIVVFAADDPISFDEAKGIVQEIRERNNKRAPIFLVANKIDLYNSEELWASKEFRTYAIKNKLHFAAISAKNTAQVTDTFRRVLGEIGNFHPSEMKKRRQSMPNARNNGGVEVNDIKRLARRHVVATMTISYTGNFCRLLIRWKGSLWRLVWKELLIFLILYYFIRLFYYHVLPLFDQDNPEKYKNEFERIAIMFDQYTKLIPLTFLLGFYVSNVVIRWWKQFECLPWPEDLLSLLCMIIPNNDEKSQLRRHTIARYVNLSAALVYREISSKIRRRFPALSDLVESGLLTDSELKSLTETAQEIKNVRWMTPLHWVQQIVTDEITDNAPNAALVNQFIQELKTYRIAFRKLFSYDWICVPLVYTQVAALATYAHFGFCLLGRQYLDPSKNYKNYEVDLIIPIFTIVQFLFFVGWFKVGQDLMRPFGMDDDDFELDYIFERNVTTSFAIVDRLQILHYEPITRDKLWTLDSSGTISMPRTGVADRYKQRKPLRYIPSYKAGENLDTEGGLMKCIAWRKKWHGYE
ncbi:unnamed protein product [Thelazia callipaeda]|uniref:Bestrophin homolog n=1 Tax=Thelazia callipaeda TaxID=103827 RepID=A0A158RBW9_THECL|nr:unnamed protein product [Thelazia callipaeda]